ncbi:hypothetical protein PspTeo4_38160 [Pseudomonas sp. Teo4]|nr:hypothetical protein [Pseudomonas sp. Teo4]
MRQALANLLDNALDFTPPGGALLFELEREGERVALSLFNQGAGDSRICHRAGCRAFLLTAAAWERAQEHWAGAQLRG